MTKLLLTIEKKFLENYVILTELYEST